MASSDGAQASMESEITTLDTKKEETLASTEAQRVSESQMSVESSAGANAEVSSPLVEAEGSGQTLENATELMEKGSLALKEGDYAEAVDCFSRAVEIRAGHYGELAPECSAAYYKYGCALLYKAQEETDPLGSVPKKEGSSEENSAKHGAVTKPEFSASSVGCDAKKDTDSGQNDGDGKKDQIEAEEADGDDEEASEGDDVAEQDDDDESDLDLAWKMLDIARAIIEKNPEDTMEKVDVLSALGEVALEREDIDTSFNDYAKALSILERLVEPDSRHIAELNFRLSLVLELGSKPVDAMPYCKKAISVCKCRVQRLTDEVNSSTVSTAIVDSTNTEADQPPGGSETISVTSKEAEIKTLTDLSIDLEKKLEDLQQLVLNPTSMLPEVLKMISAQASGNGKNVASSNLNSSQMATSSGGSNSTTFSTAHTNGNSDAPVVNLGVVGRGVKRATPSSISAEAGASKKPLVDKGEGSS